MIIDWGSGFFLGLKLGIIFIVLAIEFYFLIFDKYTEQEISRLEFIILLSTAVLCFIIPIMQIRHFSISLWVVLPVPIVYGILKVVETGLTDSRERDGRNYKKKLLKKTIAERPGLPEPYAMLGDILFEEEDYRQALGYYRKSFSIEATPELEQKIKVAEKESRLKSGELWMCLECGTENASDNEKCVKCDKSKKAVDSIKDDIAKSKADIKRWLSLGILIILAPLLAIVLLILLRTVLPLNVYIFFAIGVSLFLIYFAARKFFSW